MAFLRQMQHSQDEKFRVLAEENRDIKGKFTKLSEQFAYETNYLASTIDPAAPKSQPLPTLQDLVPSDPPKFDGTSKHVTIFRNQQSCSNSPLCGQSTYWTCLRVVL